MSIDKTKSINDLLDAYATLLTPYQQEIMELYYSEDYSLKEIAEQYNVSRNAILSTIKRVTKTLEEYEEKLSLVKKIDEIINIIVSSTLSDEEKERIINQINQF